MAEEMTGIGGEFAQPSAGSAGLPTQLGGQPTTISAAAGATDGIGAGHFIERDIDQDLFLFKSDDTPLMQLMLWAKKVQVDSPEVEHYMIDEPRSSVVTTQAVAASSARQFILPLATGDASIPQEFGTLLVKGVDGYTADGQTPTPGKELMIFVLGHDATTGNPICTAVNGPRQDANDEVCTVPAIPAGTTLILLSNALYETQKQVNPDLIVPHAEIVYLQKRGMNHVVSDYFEAQKKRIPFSRAMIAEAAITNFKVKGNRTLYAGRKGKLTYRTEKVGVQYIYTTEGVRYQVRKEMQKVGKWEIEELIALAKMVFTGEDVPKSVICLAGKNFLENIQCIDYSKHPEIQVTTKKNVVGWTVSNVHTVFGDFELKHDPTLDRLGWSNSAFIVSPERLVHYIFSAEHSATDRVEGEEATRQSMLVWDALALKGSCHIWVNGESTEEDGNLNAEATHFHMHSSEEAPANPQEGCVYVLINDCPGISTEAVKGTLWQYKNGSWTMYVGEIIGA